MAQPLEAGEPQASAARPRPRCQAAASAARSLSEKDSTTISAGDCAEVDGARPPPAVAISVASRCMDSACRFRRLDGLRGRCPSRRSPPGGPAARLARLPRPVELVLDARADALHQQPHRLARDLDEALHAQDVVRRRRRRRGARSAPAASPSRRQVDDEAVEVVVVVLALGVVVRRPRWRGRLSAAAPRPSSTAGRHCAASPPRPPSRRAAPSADLARARCVALGVRHQVGLVEDHEVGAEELVLVDLLQRIVVVERLSSARCAARRLPDRRRSGRRRRPRRRPPRRRRRPSRASAICGQLNALHQRLGQGEARGLDDDVLGRVRAVQQPLQRRHEIVGHGAADAAVGELDDVVLGAALDAAGSSGSRRRCRRRRTR